MGFYQWRFRISLAAAQEDLDPRWTAPGSRRPRVATPGATVPRWFHRRRSAPNIARSGFRARFVR